MSSVKNKKIKNALKKKRTRSFSNSASPERDRSPAARRTRFSDSEDEVDRAPPRDRARVSDSKDESARNRDRRGRFRKEEKKKTF